MAICDPVPHFRSSGKKESERSYHAPFHRAWEVQVEAKAGSVTTRTQAATYSTDQVRTVIDTDCMKSNTTECKRLSEDKTPPSVGINHQQCNLTAQPPQPKGWSIK